MGDGYIIVDMLLLRLEVEGGRLLGWRWEVMGMEVGGYGVEGGRLLG